MSKAHDMLKAYARTFLKEMGYTESEISEEYRLNREGMKSLIVDVVGIKPDKNGFCSIKGHKRYKQSLTTENQCLKQSGTGFKVLLG